MHEFQNNKNKTNACKIFPVEVPDLDTIYTDDVVETDIQWKLLAFIMSLNDDAIAAIKAVPSDFQVICTTLHAMVMVSSICENSRDNSNRFT